MAAERVEQLQLMINRLVSYCHTWNLCVNKDKSKIMVFGGARRLAKKEMWNFEGERIEIVKSYKYLGIVFTTGGSLDLHLAERLKLAKASILYTWKNFLLNREVCIVNKFKVFRAVSKAIMCYGSEVWGWKKYEQVDKLLRFFIKFVFGLPQNTPNYMLMLEFGRRSLSLDTLENNIKYILKVLEYDDDRFPKVLLKKIVKADCAWFKEWHRLGTEVGCDLNLSLENTVDWPSTLAELKVKLGDKEVEDNIAMARRGQYHGIYNILNYTAMHSLDWHAPMRRLGLIFRARGGLLGLRADLNFESNEDVNCYLCNMNVPEDIIHFIGQCPHFKDLRYKNFKQLVMDPQLVIDQLNGKDFNALLMFLVAAIHRRTVLMNEIIY